MNKEQANKITGGLSSPGKMPCKSFNLPALTTCPVGRVLAREESTSCSDCYALKGRYYFTNVKAALAKRYRLVRRAVSGGEKAKQRWVDAMAYLISSQGPYFRWHDSGDIFSAEYLELMLRVMRATPEVRHWIPTKEAKLLEGKDLPPNAVFRISTGRVVSGGEALPAGGDLPAAHVVRYNPGDYGSAGAIEDAARQGALLCLAKARSEKSGGEQACGTCRACWSPKVAAVIYPLH